MHPLPTAWDMSKVNADSTNDWVWPKLIESLQRDIERLRETIEATRQEAATVREAHRKELDALIEQLRSLRNDLNPIVSERVQNARLAKETRWKWIERLGWVAMGGVSLAVWEFLKRAFAP